MGQQFDRWLRGYGNWIIRHNMSVIIAAILLAILAGSGVRHLAFSTNYRIFFSQENPELTAFEQFQKTYTKNDNIMFVVQPHKGSVATPEYAEAIEWLTQEAWKIPYAIRVDSISNFQHTWAQGDQLTVEDLIRDGKDDAPDQLQAKVNIALVEPLLRGNLIASDARTTGINVTIQYPEINNLKEVPEAVAYSRDLVLQLQQRYPDLTIALTGLSMLNNAFAEAGEADAASLVPLMYLALVVLLILAFRSFSASFATLLVIGFSTVIAMGLAGYFGIKLTPVSVTAPTIILTLAIADSIHILITMIGLMREGQDKNAALTESLRINFLPVSITSLTTIVGFLSMNFSDSPPFWHLGNITAMGIAAAWLYSLAFLPAMMSVLPMRVMQRSGLLEKLQAALNGIAELVIHRQKTILVLTSVIAIMVISFIPKLELNDQFVRYFDQRVQFRNDADFATKNLTGIYIIEYSLPAKNPGGVSEHEYLQGLNTFTSWLRQQQEVTHVYSYTDIIKRLNKNMHGDDDAYHVIPEERDLAAQYLLLFELSLPYGLDLNDRINIDKSATRLTVTLQELSTAEIRQFLTRSERWLDANTPNYMHTQATSASVMFAHISQRNIESMLKGNAIAIVIIAIIMMLSLRSFSIGAMSLIPNLVPILVTFGVWTLMVGQVGMAAATVTATSLGIVVDDSVHFLAKYLRARREKGLDRADAVRYAFHTVGSAIVITTIILTVGFGVLAFSTFMINAQMGLLTAMAIVVALFFDLLLLPSLLLIGYRESHKERSDVIEQHS